MTTDIMKAIQKFNEPLIMEREMKDGTEYYKLVRMHEYDEIIEKRVRKRLNATPHEINADWRRLFDNYLENMGVSGEITPKEERARKEKSACLEVLAKSRISEARFLMESSFISERIIFRHSSIAPDSNK